MATSGHLIFNKLITNLLIQKGFGGDGIARFLFPTNPIGGGLTARYMKRSRTKSSAPVKTERAPGAPVKRGRLDEKEMVTVTLVDHAMKLGIPIELLEGTAETALTAERISKATQIKLQIENDWEEEVRELSWADNAAEFDTKFGDSRTETPATKWDAGTAKIGQNVADARMKMFKLCGFKPNVMILPFEVLRVIQYSDNELRDVVKFTGDGGNPVDMRHLQAYFKVPNIIVPEWLSDTSDQLDNEAKDLMYKGDHVGLFYVDDTLGRDVITFGKTFTTNYRGIPFLGTRTGFNENNKEEEVDVSAYWKTARIAKDCAMFLTDVLS